MVARASTPLSLTHILAYLKPKPLNMSETESAIPLASDSVKVRNHPFENHAPAWTNLQKFGFRASAVFILLICLPFDLKFFTTLSGINWSNFYWEDLSGLVSFSFGAPKFLTLTSDSGKYGLGSYVNLVISLVISLVAAAIWSVLDKKRKSYNTFQYWIFVLARYRVGFGIIAWGYKKLIPIQMTLPTSTFLNTPFGDFREQKLYWQSVGIALAYEVFLGSAEVLAGFLLLYKKTTALGAALVVVLLVNIAISNHAYDGGVHLLSFTYAVIALLILWPYLPDIWNLLVNEKDITPQHYYPAITSKSQQTSQLVLKYSSHFVFVYLLFYLHWIDTAGYRFPQSRGIAQGHYDVTEFKVNGSERPFSPLDSIRWQDAIFEKWPTVSFKIDRKQQMDLDNRIKAGKIADIDMFYELSGLGGGRHFFHYEADTVKQLLSLQNKNKAHRDQKQVLHYSQPTADRIILSGINEFKDSIYVVLDKSKKQYLLAHSRETAVISGF